MNLSPNRGRGERRVPAAPAASCAKVESTRVSHHRYPGSPGVPARNGFNGLFRALPGDRAFLSPSSADMACQNPVGPTCLRGVDAGVEASGPHDFAVRDPSTPKASTGIVPVRRSFGEGGTAPFVSAPLTAHGKPALQSRLRAQRCRVHRIPPRVRDDRDTPLKWGGTAGVIDLIWVRRKLKYRFDLGQAKTEIFLQMGLDSQFTDLPVGQSADLSAVEAVGPGLPSRLCQCRFFALPPTNVSSTSTMPPSLVSGSIRAARLTHFGHKVFSRLNKCCTEPAVSNARR